MQVITVGRMAETLHIKISRLDLSRLWVSGEISNVKPRNGHWFFNLKDSRGQISCSLWSSIAARLPFEPKEGMQVQVKGHLDFYQQRGTISFIVERMQPDGIGALYLELEERKKRLAAAGYFQAAHKKPRPARIENIAIVTGENTAALQDVMKTISTRWPMLQVTLYPALVQGASAPAQIVKALKAADKGGHDAVLLVRGGGSMEDLFCFNDEEIVKTLYDMNTYTVSGVGHEIDTTLADLAADHRAVTPTAAAQWITPDWREVFSHIQSMQQQMNQRVQRMFMESANRLMWIQSNPWLSSPQKWLEARKAALQAPMLRLESLQKEMLASRRNLLLQQNMALGQAVENFERRQKSRLQNTEVLLKEKNPRNAIAKAGQNLNALSLQAGHAMENRLNQTRNHVKGLQELLAALNPENVLKKGYVMVSKDGKPVDGISGLTVGEQISLQFWDGAAKAGVEEITNGK